MELRDEIYLEVAPKWQGKFDNIPRDFVREFNRAYDSAVQIHKTADKEQIKKKVIELLSVLLKAYSTTEPTTKTGKVLRSIAGFFSSLASLFKPMKP